MAAASSFASLIAFAALLAAVVLPAWAPFLLADRVRTLFGSWPTGSLVANYLLVGAGVVVAQLLAYALVVAALGGVSSSDGPERFFGALFLAHLLVPAAGWLVAGVALPRRGSWDPTGGGVDGRLVLALGGLWYAFVTSVVVAALVFVLTFLFLPL